MTTKLTPDTIRERQRKENPALFDALQARKPDLAEAFTIQVRSGFERAKAAFGENFKGVSSSFDSRARFFVSTVRPLCDAPDGGDRWNPAYFLNDNKVARAAERYADEVVMSWFDKITAKMGTLEAAQVQHLSGVRFTIRGTKAGRSVAIEQDMIVNVSSKGTLFNQFPARIYVDGKFMSEAKFKAL